MTRAKSCPTAACSASRPTAKNVQLLTTDLTGPNGLAFSPDEKYFYVDDWDDKKKVIMRYEVNPDGTLVERQSLLRHDRPPKAKTRSMG